MEECVEFAPSELWTISENVNTNYLEQNVMKINKLLKIA